MPILPVKPQGDKVSRAHAVSPLVESGRGERAALVARWLNDFIDELTSFPAAAHDDMVDAFTQALGYMRGSSFDWAMTFEESRVSLCPAPAREVSAGGETMNNVNDMLAREDGIREAVAARTHDFLEGTCGGGADFERREKSRPRASCEELSIGGLNIVL